MAFLHVAGPVTAFTCTGPEIAKDVSALIGFDPNPGIWLSGMWRKISIYKSE